LESRNHRIAVLAGDGIGEEVVREGLKVLRTAATRFGFRAALKEYPYGTDHFLKTGEILPDAALAEMKGMSAILLGAIGDPRVEVGKMEFGIIARLRFDLDLYVNLRPIRLYAEHLGPLKGKTPADVDLVVVRENTEDAYAGIHGFLHKGGPDEVAIQEMVYTRKGVERVIRYAFELARRRDRKKKLTLIDKANAVRAQDIWTRVFEEVGREFPDIEKDHAYVDACCMWLVKNPEWFDVAVAPNLFGDIVTDLGAMIQGGMGIAASGNIHPGRVSMFEPIHGSAPKYRGQGKANPLATINAVAMMLEYLGEKDAARAIEGAIERLLVSKRIPHLGAGALPTSEIGDLVVAEIAGAPAAAAPR
jgi:3-isopropylmalate dehydrogenase